MFGIQPPTQKVYEFDQAMHKAPSQDVKREEKPTKQLLDCESYQRLLQQRQQEAQEARQKAFRFEHRKSIDELAR